jgi:hypothetical protein
MSEFEEEKKELTSSVAGLIRKPRLTTLKNILNQLLEGIAATDEEQRDISCLGKLAGLLRSSADT